MKYDWANMTEQQKIKATQQEVYLETHNGTTKEDLLNIVKWLWDKFDVVKKNIEPEKFTCESRKDEMCSTRDYGLNQYKDPCYHCCIGCNNAIEMTCSFVCPLVAEHYHPSEG